jgi:hypothetical protein
VSQASYLLLYFPICFVVMLVLEACRSDDPARVARRALSNFASLTAVLAVGGAIVWVINKYL